MKSIRYIASVVATVLGFSCSAGDHSYYRDFLTASNDKRPPFQLTSTSLVDTNNCSPTVRQRPLSLALGVLGGVRLGMSMDDVVSLWGKPLAIGCCRSNHPSFSFDDVWVSFEGNQVCEVGLYISRPWTPQFAEGLVPISRKEEWIRFLGQPAAESTNASALLLRYETNQTLTTLSFGLQDKWLSDVHVSRPSGVQATGKSDERR